MLLLAAALLGWSAVACAQSIRDEELDALLHTFASFTRWPAGALRADQEPLLFCLQGSATLRSQMPAARRGGPGTTVRRVVASDDLRRCHLLFVPAVEHHRLRDSAASVMGAPGAARSGSPPEVRQESHCDRTSRNMSAAVA